MKKFTTIICCIAFAIFGIGLAKHGVGPPDSTTTMSVNAATVNTEWTIPNINLQNAVHSRPLVDADEHIFGDIELLAQMPPNQTLIDSLTQRIQALEKDSVVARTALASVPKPTDGKPKVKVKIKKVTIRDTIWIAKQIGEEQPTKCTPVYKIEQVGEICPSEEHVNERESGVHG